MCNTFKGVILVKIGTLVQNKQQQKKKNNNNEKVKTGINMPRIHIS